MADYEVMKLSLRCDQVVQGISYAFGSDDT